ncbi:hypothetical protein NLJ89_g11513 [Agrocybe chaxingu]|uniref:Helicase C-terminal domain-containing protein n=1 Tax=Agrocybe chaxingu TaxID=84603 RepID=A0A9W8JWM8_9AGAR|nr:hypothetical protein NLJ89_g11513 [Agrocybe chaxingu]
MNKPGPTRRKVQLKWHQAVGVASILDKTFHGPNEAKPGNILLCDAVGVGKTCQVMATIAFLQALWTSGLPRLPGRRGCGWFPPAEVTAVARQITPALGLQEGESGPCSSVRWTTGHSLTNPEDNQSLPHYTPAASLSCLADSLLIEDKSYFMGHERVPNLPHLLIVPNAVVDQWISELKRFNVEGSMDIFRLGPSAEAVAHFFTSPDSKWNESHQELIKRVVVCPHSAFNNLTSHHFYTFRRPAGVPPDTPRDVRAASIELGASLFSQKWLLMAADELHDMRGENARGFAGVCGIWPQAALSMGITATPIFSKPTDLLNIARMLGFRGFTLEQGHAKVRAWMIDHRAAHTKKKNDDKRNSENLQSTLDKVVHGRLIDSSLDPTIHTQAAAYKAIRAWIPELTGRIIRRTHFSLRYDGQTINNIPPMTNVHIPVRLTAGETVRLDQELQKLKSTASKAIETNWEEFLTGYRVTLAYPHWTESSQKDGKKVFTPVSDINDWQGRIGSKAQALVNVIRHYLGHDQALHPTSDDDGVVTYPPHPAVPEGERPPQTRKIMVYFNFTMMADLLVSVLHVNGIEALCLTGGIPIDRRSGIVREFQERSDVRVLLFTSVGSTGLNMTCANVMIHYDMSWSAVYQEQINGRIWRLGQETDGNMTDTLWAKKPNDTLEAVLKGDPISSVASEHSEDEAAAEDADLLAQVSKSLTKKSGKKRKGKASQPGANSDDEDDQHGEQHQKRPTIQLPDKSTKVIVREPGTKDKGKGKAKSKSKKGTSEDPIDIDTDAPVKKRKAKGKASTAVQGGEGQAKPKRGKRKAT